MILLIQRLHSSLSLETTLDARQSGHFWEKWTKQPQLHKWWLKEFEEFLTEWQHGFIKGRSCETQLIFYFYFFNPS